MRMLNKMQHAYDMPWKQGLKGEFEQRESVMHSHKGFAVRVLKLCDKLSFKMTD